MRRRLLASLLLAASFAATAAPPPATQREIAGLFAALEHSGCRFARNGTWYDAHKAREHLQRKYDWLLRRDAIARSEDFIELAATKSSMSGRPYLVQCPGAAAVQSGPWFRAALARVRAAH
ncbi:DUF5329 domain-containing protein [Cognatilysobacter segetis]|uniref:DUF5329 family protein n=1 Tax=Cognatilysobacter segetis TaxID=2492394 RepID=UPI00105F3FC4|nr:DUF5329 domain-containing protein [Lysobacter segetis]